VTLLYDILDRYLYKENVQDLARERGLPTSWHKDEIIEALLNSGRFAPAEALEYLNVREFRRLCREYRLDSTGSRDELFTRVLDAVWKEERQSTPTRDPSRDPRESRPNLPSETSPQVAKPNPPKGSTRRGSPVIPSVDPVPLNRVRESPLGASRVPPTLTSPASSDAARDLSRVHPDATGAWALAMFLAGGFVVVIYDLTSSQFGVDYGVIAFGVSVVATAVALTVTAPWWAHQLARFIHRAPGRTRV
jgi:hypothetical protein